MSKETYSPFDWYETPIYYDIVFDEDTDIEADFLERMLDMYGKSDGRDSLEPACGTGRLMLELGRRGFDVTGFDISRPSLDYAKKRLEEEELTGEVFEGRMEAFETERQYDMAYSMVSTFKYILELDDAKNHLRCVAKALKPGGIYILGFHLTHESINEESVERWTGQRGKTQVVCKIKSWAPDHQARRERVRSRLVVREGNDVKRYETEWDFRLYNADEVRELIASVPELEHVGTWDFHFNRDRTDERLERRYDCVLILRKVAED